MHDFNEPTLDKVHIGYGCLFCKTGSEKKVAHAVCINADVQAIAPEKNLDGV